MAAKNSRRGSLFLSLSPGTTGISWTRTRQRRRRRRNDFSRSFDHQNSDDANHNLRTPAFIFDSAKLRQERPFIEGRKQSCFADLLIGLINSIVLVPTMVGFTSIIYRDDFFTSKDHDYFPLLLKLVFLSSTIHQLCFMIISSLPFAVGQVQDAGLIFLASMAGNIVQSMQGHRDPEEIVTTVVVALAIMTAMLGTFLIFVGYFKLANLVQYLPLPVIGGYLAFIGLFCGESGLRIMANRTDIVGLIGLRNLFNAETLKLASPGFVATGMLFAVSRKVENKIALPLLLFCFPCIFYLIMLATNSSFDDVRHAGWVKGTTNVPPFWEVFHLFNMQNVRLSYVFPAVLPDFFAMCAVVAFGSCLDVAAIQFEMGRPLDYDHELKSVGLSNLISGVTGGYTGSYIFSQSIFALRNGVTTRIASGIIVLVESAIFFLPLDLLGFLPRFFFGSVLLFVAVDLLLDWLIISYFKVEFKEYLIILLTFFAINLTSLVSGMAIGLIATAMNFIYMYSRMNQVQKIKKPTANIIRALTERQALDMQYNRIVALKLTGFQFFGTTRGVIGTVEDNIRVAKTNSDDVRIDVFGNSFRRSSTIGRQYRTMSEGIDERVGHSASRSTRNIDDWDIGMTINEFETQYAELSDSPEKTTRFVILECSGVTMIDATAARACFLTLLLMLQDKEIDLVFAGLSIECEQILVNHGVIAICNDEESWDESYKRALSYSSMDEAVRNCEDILCSGLYLNPRQSSGLEKLFPNCVKRIGSYFDLKSYSPHTLIVKSGENANAIYIVQRGAVIIQNSSCGNFFNTTSIFGHVDFFAPVPVYTFSATTDSNDEQVLIHVMTRTSFEQLVEEDPKAAIRFQQMIMQAIIPRDCQD